MRRRKTRERSTSLSRNGWISLSTRSRGLKRCLISLIGLCEFYFLPPWRDTILNVRRYLFHDINSMRFFGKPFGLTEKGGDLHSLIRASQEGANFVHALARLPWLKGILLDGFLGRWLAPKSNDGTPFGDVLKIRDDLIDARLAAGRAEKSRGDGLD